MAEVLLFNPKTLAQMFLDSYAKRQDIERLKGEGWLENPRLVHMHHPLMKKDVMIPVQDRKMWEDKGYYAEPTMIYHPTEQTRMVSAEEAKRAFTKGWYASPAHFPGNDIGKIKTPNVMKEAV